MLIVERKKSHHFKKVIENSLTVPETQIGVKWYKDSTLLGETLPPRVRIHANYSLQLDWLQPTDTALYTCEVSN